VSAMEQKYPIATALALILAGLCLFLVVFMMLNLQEARKRLDQQAARFEDQSTEQNTLLAVSSVQQKTINILLDMYKQLDIRINGLIESSQLREHLIGKELDALRDRVEVLERKRSPTKWRKWRPCQPIGMYGRLNSSWVL